MILPSFGVVTFGLCASKILALPPSPYPPLPAAAHFGCTALTPSATRTNKTDDIVDGVKEAVVQQEKELAEERKRQNNVLDDQSEILQSLKGKAKERGTALAKTTLEVSRNRKFSCSSQNGYRGGGIVLMYVEYQRLYFVRCRNIAHPRQHH